MLKLYLLTQTVNNGWETYDSADVCAESTFLARQIEVGSDVAWAKPEDVQVKEIGIANDSIEIGEIICSSFNAG